MKKKLRPENRINVLFMATLFLICFLANIMIGAGTYRKVMHAQSENRKMRIVNSYLIASLREGDHTDGVDVITLEDTKVLLINSRNSDYAKRIYLYDGTLMEDFEKANAALGGYSAISIGELQSFDVENQGDLWVVTTDLGKTSVRLKCGKGDAK